MRNALCAQIISILVVRRLCVLIAFLDISSTRFQKSATSARKVRFALKERQRNARQDMDLCLRLSVIPVRLGIMASMEFAKNAKQALIKTRKVNKAARSARYLECTPTKGGVNANSAHLGASVQTQPIGSYAMMAITHWAALENAESAHLATYARLRKVQLSCVQQAHTAVKATAKIALGDTTIL